MSGIGEKQREIIQAEFDRSISIDFTGATIASDAGILLLRRVDERFKILEKAAVDIWDPRSSTRRDHSVLDLLRQRAYQMQAGYEDGSDADYLRIDPALRPAFGKKDAFAAGRPTLCALKMTCSQPTRGCGLLERAFPMPRQRFCGGGGCVARP